MTLRILGDSVDDPKLIAAITSAVEAFITSSGDQVVTTETGLSDWKIAIRTIHDNLWSRQRLAWQNSYRVGIDG